MTVPLERVYATIPYKLICAKHNGLIKVITGMSRYGRSYLLFTLFKQHLRSSGVAADHIIEIAFDSFESKKFRDLEVLYPHVKAQIADDQMYYILLCLSSECYGMDIMDKVPQMTDGRVKVGSGTLYNLLEQFLDADMIKETKAEGRRRCYILTDKGRELLDNEYKRLNSLVSDYQRLMGKEDTQ